MHRHANILWNCNYEYRSWLHDQASPHIPTESDSTLCTYFQSSNAKYNSQEQQLATRKRPELHKDKTSLYLSKSSSCCWECDYTKFESLFSQDFYSIVCRRDGKQPFGEVWITGAQSYWEWRGGDIWDCTIERCWGSHYTPEQVSAHVLSLISVCIHVYGYCHFKLINPISFHYN